ncbi:MAG TPA: D-alanyl-D-alanine carboxypeptidase [Actinomycetota bacterium]|jgi:D-alanyl-D-alanine carboxypeptidase/D-alanyl-D-alanine-endopeptidase (penicillin-binding protein 4)
MRRPGIVLLALTLNLAITAPAFARPAWKQKIDRAIGGRSMGVSVHYEGKAIYEHASKARRVPASNEKLLLSMGLYATLTPEYRIPTSVYGPAPADGVIRGKVWLSGRGDPTITAGGRFGRSLPFRATGLTNLARQLKNAGVRKIKGRVMGDTGFFGRDWYAPGWKSSFPAEEVPLPSALTFEGNTHKGAHITNPEWRAARALTQKLKARGIKVAKGARAANMPVGQAALATTFSRPLHVLVQFMNRKSSNFFAEVFGKLLGVMRNGAPGTIAKGADAIENWWASKWGVALSANDGSGLSYDNRVSPRGITRLLDVADDHAWGAQLRKDLPTGGQGTLEDRLHGIPVRAKTGTLDGVSALSGWVWLRREKAWATFSMLSSGMPKYSAAVIEDRIVNVLHRAAN